MKEIWNLRKEIWGNPGEIDFGSSLARVRVIGSQLYNGIKILRSGRFLNKPIRWRSKSVWLASCRDGKRMWLNRGWFCFLDRKWLEWRKRRGILGNGDWSAACCQGNRHRYNISDNLYILINLDFTKDDMNESQLLRQQQFNCNMVIITEFKL